MSTQPKRGISGKGLDAAFDAEDLRKSNLILEGQFLRLQGNLDEAASRMAQAAEIEERLADLCEEKGLREKARLHRFSAANCWSQAGNLYDVLRVCGELLADDGLPEQTREQVQKLVGTARSLLARWDAEARPQVA